MNGLGNIKKVYDTMGQNKEVGKSTKQRKLQKLQEEIELWVIVGCGNCGMCLEIEGEEE